MDLLDAATALERFEFKAPPPPDAAQLCAFLGRELPLENGETLMFELHAELATRLCGSLRSRYELCDLDHNGLELKPRERAEIGVLALHGAHDVGRSFAGVFFEMASSAAVHLISPTLGHGDDEQVICDGLRRLQGVPTFVVGLSAGGVSAWRYRDRLETQVLGAVAVAAAPWRYDDQRSAPPFLFIHGLLDRHFPAREVERFVAGRPHESLELCLVEGFAHSFPYRILARYAHPWMLRRLREQGVRHSKSSESMESPSVGARQAPRPGPR
ncbi:MAG: hypothetical protein NVS3B20_00540 [Polyangiales bacterium]